MGTELDLTHVLGPVQPGRTRYLAQGVLSSGPPSGLGRWLVLLTTAALVALAVRAATVSPFLAAALLVAALALVVWRRVQHRRARAALRSGDPEQVLATWQHALQRLPHPQTTVPLMAATALAAGGMTERARNMLRRAARGPAWDATQEHRLFIEAILDAFEGERGEAIRKAEQLEALPLPPTSRAMRRRVASLRAAVGALTRAFARRSNDGDLSTLKKAARLNPLLHWSMSYAAAIVHVDRGETGDAQAILQDAPAWPRESAFSWFHAELVERAS